MYSQIFGFGWGTEYDSFAHVLLFIVSGIHFISIQLTVISKLYKKHIKIAIYSKTILIIIL